MDKLFEKGVGSVIFVTVGLLYASYEVQAEALSEEMVPWGD